MRVGLNLLYLIPGIVGGTETYAAGLLQGLAKTAANDEFFVFVNQETADWPLPPAPNFKRIVCPVTASTRAQRYYFEQVKLPRLLRQHRTDLVHSLGYVGPIFSSCPTVVSIPDLNYIDQAQTMSFQRRFALNSISRLAASRAKHVVTISAYSKERLRHSLKLSTDKITVTHLAQRPHANSHTSESWADVQQKHHISQPYIVAFGGGAVHKNIPALLQAFRILQNKFPHKLVLIGHLPPDPDSSIARLQKDLPGRIITTGYVPDDHIYPLLSHAELFVMPSLYEGFGLPVLEAQQAGVAVACSTAGALPEVAGDGALFFDPHSLDAIVEAITRCLSDAALRTKLRHRGQENLERFSWQKTAAQTLDVYRQVSGCK